jgi:CrcB protein
MMNWIAIAIGGAIGAVSRYGIAQIVILINGANAAPFATIMVNVIGSGLMGVIYGYLSTGGMLAETVRVFIMIGFLGALTTFSTFSMDIMAAIDRGQVVYAVIYAAVSVAGSILAFILAVLMMRAISGAG